jgi:hypothetical protein
MSVDCRTFLNPFPSKKLLETGEDCGEPSSVERWRSNHVLDGGVYVVSGKAEE